MFPPLMLVYEKLLKDALPMKALFIQHIGCLPNESGWDFQSAHQC
jgi:hypothetical protein